MVQTDYGYISDIPYYEGQLATAWHKNTSHYVNAGTVVIPFGRVVVKGVGDRDAVLPSGPGQIVLGITVSSQTYEQAFDANGDIGFPIDREMDVLEEGDIAVVVEEAVVPGDAVYFRHTANGAGKNVISRFRNDADANTCDQLTGVRWIKSASGAGAIAVLRINRP